jgi:hypothetical protein
MNLVLLIEIAIGLFGLVAEANNLRHLEGRASIEMPVEVNCSN